MMTSNPNAPPPDAILLQMLMAPMLEKSICIAAKLGIADLLAKNSATAEELAQQTKVHGPSLYRILRMLATAGIFAETEDHKFVLTPVASPLRSDVPQSMRDFTIMMGEKWLWDAWGEFEYSVETGGAAHDKVQGMGSFEFFTKNKEAGRVFNNAMTNLSLSCADPIAEAYDYSRFETLVDIAGGHGILLSRILKANPKLRGILFDLPSVIDGAPELLRQEGVSDRVDLKSGSFFESVPEGADAYIMKHIIHDWNDDSSCKILENIRSVMKSDSKILIVEMVVPPGNEPHPSKALDLMMLIMEGGKERTKEEYATLLQDSRLKLNSIYPTKSPYSIVEAVRN